MKKRLGGVMQTAMAILLCMAAVLCVTRLQTGHAPREDARAASRMLYSPGEVLYDGDRVTAMDSANDAEVPEDETPSDQPDAPESSQPDDTPTPDAPPVDSDTASSDGRDGIGDLLDIADNGGGSGGQTPDHAAPGDVTVPEAPDAALYFTTSIIDGETTAEETYTFTITHQPQREPIGLAVTVNGRELRYAAQTTSVTVHLAAGANTIVVSADYREDGGTVRATRSYTVYYAQPGELIIVAKRTSDGRQLGELGTVSEGALTFTACAERDGSTYPVQSVELNGRTLAGSGGSYTADLNSGENRIRVKASYQSSTADVTYTITYNASAFQISTTISDTVIDDSTAQSSASFEKVTVDSQQYKFRLHLNPSTGKESIDRIRVSDSTGTFSLTQDSDDRYTVDMGREDRMLYIDYKDSTGRSKTYKYLLHFQRGAEDTPEDRQPTIIAQVEADGTVIGLTNGLTMKTPDLIVLVDGRSCNGQQLYANNYTVSVNGTVVSAPISQSGYQFGYTAYLSNVGANTITITATDGDGYAATRSWTVYYEEGTVTVTVSVEATTVGLGYLVPPTEVTVPGGTDAWSIVEKVLTENGYTVSVRGSYLSAIQRSGICSGFFIDSELMDLIMADGMDENGAGLDPQPFSMDSLGELDFYRWSGWMYSYNGSYPGYGMNVCKPQDGSVIRVRYTLALGKDIGGYSSANGNYGVSSGNYYKEW
ncbi:MAG: hypothetical protein BHW35_03410 [Firmicutes bacterium CAG:176_63_11]|nr:MAG: hypothetical protein BHW35_03410 [Firmicutes bacterium CAG:176_63_11]